MVDQLFQCLSIVAGTKKIEHEPRVKVARTRAHHESTGGRESHRCIYGNAVLNGGHAGSISQMGDDDLSFPILFERAHDIFIGKSMKSITPDSLLPKLA